MAKTQTQPQTQAQTTERPAQIAERPKPATQSELVPVMDSAKFDQMQRVANVLANSALTPKHLLGATPDQTRANCFRVVNQAMRWEMDPFAVADETYVVHGKLAYQGKLVAAVINARANLKERLKPTYSGKGEALTVTIHGTFRGEAEERTIELSVAQAKTANEMWKKDPEQKLFYSGVVKWCRRHCPELLLGVLTEDDLERIQQEPEAVDALKQRLATVQTNGQSAAEALRKHYEQPTEPAPEPAELTDEAGPIPPPAGSMADWQSNDNPMK